ncbi:hypothetical protein RYX36_024319, partial [Vicia faba]
PGVSIGEHKAFGANIFTYKGCESLCLQQCNCTGFQYTYKDGSNIFECYTKLQLLNGRHSPIFPGTTYLRLPKGKNFSKQESVSVKDHICLVQLSKHYFRKPIDNLVRFFLWISIAVGGLEFVFFIVVGVCLNKTKKKSSGNQNSYHHAILGFRRYSYYELKVATKNFSNEIGRGGGGVVYRGTLPDQRDVAIKRLNEAKQGE